MDRLCEFLEKHPSYQWESKISPKTFLLTEAPTKQRYISQVVSWCSLSLMEQRTYHWFYYPPKTTPQKHPAFGAILGLFKICRVSGRKSHMWCIDLYEGDLYSKKKVRIPGIVRIHGFWYLQVSWHMSPKTGILQHFSFGPISSTALRPGPSFRIRWEGVWG